MQFGSQALLHSSAILEIKITGLHYFSHDVSAISALTVIGTLASFDVYQSPFSEISYVPRRVALLSEKQVLPVTAAVI